MIGSPEIPIVDDPVVAARYLKYGNTVISIDSPKPKITEYTEAEIEMLGFIPKELENVQILTELLFY